MRIQYYILKHFKTIVFVIFEILLNDLMTWNAFKMTQSQLIIFTHIYNIYIFYHECFWQL